MVDAPTDPGVPANAPSVDELFARIRAGSNTDPGGAGAGAPSAPSSEGGAEVAAEATASDGEPVEAPEAPDALLGAETAVPAGPDAEIIGRRDELFTPIAGKLNRTVKRTLGDDQNRMLDLLRSTPSIDADGLLGPEDAHLALFADAVQEQLGEAYVAGATFAGNTAAGTPKGDAVDQAATGLARAVVAMLRRRIADGSEEPGRAVGAAFREWRGQRVERLAGRRGDARVLGGGGRRGGARSRRQGALGGDLDGRLLGLRGQRPGRCAASTEVFPTGHAFPPAHSGCRCLVAPADG